MRYALTVPIYKYLDREEYALALIDNGEMMFRPVSTYGAMDDGKVRGDPFDASLRYKPAGGLKLDKVDGTVVDMPHHHFRSSVHADDIFVFCASVKLSIEIAEKFAAPYCVEIEKTDELVNRLRIRVQRKRKFDSKNIYHGAVDYRDLSIAPLADLALPEKVALIKPPEYTYQNEYRIVIGRYGALLPENVDLEIRHDDDPPAGVVGPDERVFFRIGNIARIAKLHVF